MYVKRNDGENENMTWLDQNLNSIVLGDCYELMKNIPDNSIDCVYTDIPYLYSKGGGKGNTEIDKRKIKIRNELSEKDLDDGIKEEILHEIKRVMKNANCFIWCSRLQVPGILNFFNDKNTTFDILFWGKTNPIPTANNSWLSDVEYCLYFREKRKIKFSNNYNLKSKYYVSGINKSDKELYHHPTIKPLNLVKRHLKLVVQEGIVFDPFSGSGTTCQAAKELGLNYLGMEIDAGYHKISIDRLNGITADGQTSIFTDFEHMEDTQ